MSRYFPRYHTQKNHQNYFNSALEYAMGLMSEDDAISYAFEVMKNR